MEEKYILQELQTNDIFTNKTLKRLLFIIWLIGVIIISILTITEPFLWFIFAFAYSSIFGILTLTIYLFPKNNTEYKQLKDIGKKEQAYIIDTGFSRHGNSRGIIFKRSGVSIFDYGKLIKSGNFSKIDSMGSDRYTYKLFYITILYNGSLKNIYKFDGNSISYRILQVLLETYPTKRVEKIPIDVYCYKNKIYADFESVDLTKVESFEEARKIVENTWLKPPMSVVLYILFI